MNSKNIMQGDSTFSSYIKKLRNYPILTAEQEKNLAQKISQGDLKAREQFITANLRLVVLIVKKYQTSTMVDFMDLIQEGNLGLIKAIDSFDYTKGVRFSTFATYYIKNEINRAIINKWQPIRVPVYLNGLINKYNSIQDRYYKLYNRPATSLEISKEMGISKDKVAEIKSAIFNIISTNIIVSDDESELGDIIVDYNNLKPEEEFISKYIKEIIYDLMSSSNLKENEAFVIRMRFGLEDGQIHSLEQIGKILKKTREWIRVLEKNALKKLRVVAQKKYGEDFF